MSVKEALEKNKVMLWGVKAVKSSLLKEYDVGNKNPRSKKRAVKEEDEVEEEKPKKGKVKKEFILGDDYGVDDLEFLRGEYERIEELISNVKDKGEADELYDKQDALYELIEGLEAMEKMKGGMIRYNNPSPAIELNKQIKGGMIRYNNTSPAIALNKQITGRGFKKGSPEALAHAEKMRIARNKDRAPKAEVVKKATKSRVVKGSEEAKALARKLVEARKAKMEIKKKEEEEKLKKEQILNPVKPKGKPWYFIGDIPKGYREATEVEAIKNNHVSEYGKYQVDETRLMLYRDYDILLDETKPLQEVTWAMNGLKKRIIDSLKNIEVFSSKLENPKYDKKADEFKTKLNLEKDKRKYLQAGYNWYYKIYCEFKGIKYERQKIELPKREEIKVNKSIYVPKPEKKIIDPRTGKEAEMSIYTGDEEIKENSKMVDADVDLHFSTDTDKITLSTKYFTPDYKLKPAFVPKLIKKNIILQKKHYTTEDYNKYFYKMPASMTGGNLSSKELNELLDASYNNKVENVEGFTKDKSLSTKTSKVFVNPQTGQTVVAHRGTEGASDWLNNAAYVLGNTTAYKMTPRYKEAKKVQKNAEKKYGRENISTIGHSQGGLQAELLGSKGKETITVNKATRPFGNVSSKNQTDISSSGDLVSSFNPFQSFSNKGKTHVIKAKTRNPLTEHSYDILKRGNRIF